MYIRTHVYKRYITYKMRKISKYNEIVEKELNVISSKIAQKRCEHNPQKR